MATDLPKHWHLLCYDIRSDRRLQRVHRFVAGQALAVQRSVFLFHGTDIDLSLLATSIEACITREDDVRIYPISHPGQVRVFRGEEFGAFANQDNPEILLLDGLGGDVIGYLHPLMASSIPEESGHAARGGQ